MVFTIHGVYRKDEFFRYQDVASLERQVPKNRLTDTECFSYINLYGSRDRKRPRDVSNSISRIKR